MADNQRNRIFASFLGKQFSDPPDNILDVACGDGRLTVNLAEIFPFATVTGIDPKPRGNRRRVKVLRGKFPDRIKAQRYDLIVGMHPDEATWPIVETCCKHKISFAVVPCCLLHVPKSFPGGNLHNWVLYIANYVNSMGMKSQHTELPMRGANQIVFAINN